MSASEVLFTARLPPSNVAAEQALLGTLLSNNRSYNAVSSFLRPEHFADPIAGRIYQAIIRRIEAGQVADAISLKGEFENSGILEEVGGTKYLTDLLAAMVSPLMAGDYGRVIHDTWARRQIIEVAEAMAVKAYGDGSGEDAPQIVAQLQDEIAALESQVMPATGTQVRGTTTVYDAFMAAVDRAEGISKGMIAKPFTTGLPAIDRMMGGGVSPDSLIYMIGAGGAGKTELALQIAESVALEAYEAWVAGGQEGPCPGVLYIMLGNMTVRQLGARTAARHANMRLAPIRRGTIDMEQGVKLVQAGKIVVQIPLEISDTGPPTLARCLGEMRRFAKRRPLILTIIDNFSDMLSVNSDKMFGTAIATTQALKSQGATATGSAVMLLMHLNSSVEGSTKRSAKPRPSDIPWGTKKDADFAFGVWRPINYMESKPERPAKKLSAEGEDMYLRWIKEWEDKREPWPVGIKNITEVVPMKIREEDEDRANEIGRLKFDRDTHRFVDVETIREDVEVPNWGVPD